MNNFDKVTRLEVDIKDLDLGIGQEEEGPAGLDVSEKSRLSEVREWEDLLNFIHSMDSAKLQEAKKKKVHSRQIRVKI